MAAFSEEIVEIKCDPHKILNNTYLYRFFCSKVKSFHSMHKYVFLMFIYQTKLSKIEYLLRYALV